MKKTLLGVATAIALGLAGLVATPAQAAPESNPVRFCQYLQTITDENDPLFGLDEFIATTPGGCVSTIASIGLEELTMGAFPSTASAVGNCKALEAGGIDYPYYFYGDVFTSVEATTAVLVAEGTPPDVAAALAPVIVANYLANQDAFLARNRAGCVRVLRGLHSGELFGLIFPAG